MTDVKLIQVTSVDYLRKFLLLIHGSEAVI